MPKEKWGISICTVDGQRFSIGDVHDKFTVQSTSKPITYSLTLEELGTDEVHKYQGREPSGRMFNEIVLDHNSKYIFWWKHSKKSWMIFGMYFNVVGMSKEKLFDMWRNYEFSNIHEMYSLKFFEVQNWDCQTGQRQLLEKNKYYIIFQNFIISSHIK